MSAASDAIRGVFLGNLGTKFVALLAAVGLWFYIGKELTGVEVFHAELTISLSDDIRQDWRILDNPVRRVKVTLEGPAKMIDTLRGREGEVLQGRAVIDAKKLGGKSALMPGGKTIHTLEMQESFFQPLPYVALKLKGMEPGEVTIELGALVTEELEVDLARLTSDIENQKGRPKDMDVAVRISRTKVKVRGPSEAINALKGKLPLAPVPIEDASGTLIEQGRLHPDVEAAHITWATKAHPTVTVLISPKPKERSLAVVVERVVPHDLKLPPNTEWKMDDTVEVVLTGPADLVAQVTPEDLIVFAAVPVDVPRGAKFQQALATLTPAWRRRRVLFKSLDVALANNELDFQIRVPPPPKQPETPPGGNGSENGGGSGDNGGSSGNGGGSDEKK
jgi:hypothetical protein